MKKPQAWWLILIKQHQYNSAIAVRQGSGSMIFLKPGHMRWDYIAPDHQVLISDGESITMYFEKSNQMIISNARDYLQSDVTYSFFSGTGDILKDFDIDEPDFKNVRGEFSPYQAHPQIDSSACIIYSCLDHRWNLPA